jgi:hypothetical protein
MVRLNEARLRPPSAASDRMRHCRPISEYDVVAN